MGYPVPRKERYHETCIYTYTHTKISENCKYRREQKEGNCWHTSHFQVHMVGGREIRALPKASQDFHAMYRMVDGRSRCFGKVVFELQ